MRIAQMVRPLAFADIDPGLAVAVMRNRFSAGDLTAATRIDRIVAATVHKSTGEMP